jgi:hypothetical protein
MSLDLGFIPMSAYGARSLVEMEAGLSLLAGVLLCLRRGKRKREEPFPHAPSVLSVSVAVPVEPVRPPSRHTAQKTGGHHEWPGAGDPFRFPPATCSLSRNEQVLLHHYDYQHSFNAVTTIKSRHHAVDDRGREEDSAWWQASGQELVVGWNQKKRP